LTEKGKGEHKPFPLFVKGHNMKNSLVAPKSKPIERAFCLSAFKGIMKKYGYKPRAAYRYLCECFLAE